MLRQPPNEPYELQKIFRNPARRLPSWNTALVDSLCKLFSGIRPRRIMNTYLAHSPHLPATSGGPSSKQKMTTSEQTVKRYETFGLYKDRDDHLRLLLEGV